MLLFKIGRYGLGFGWCIWFQPKVPTNLWRFWWFWFFREAQLDDLVRWDKHPRFEPGTGWRPRDGRVYRYVKFSKEENDVTRPDKDKEENNDTTRSY